MRTVKIRLSAAQTTAALTHRFACMVRSSSRMCAHLVSSAWADAASKKLAHTFWTATKSVRSIRNVLTYRPPAVRKGTAQMQSFVKATKCLVTLALIAKSVRVTTATRAIWFAWACRLCSMQHLRALFGLSAWCLPFWAFAWSTVSESGGSQAVRSNRETRTDSFSLAQRTQANNSQRLIERGASESMEWTATKSSTWVSQGDLCYFP